MSISAPASHVIIIGGGIGGLAAAIALRQVGIAATVYERASQLREVGAGLSLWPNAVKALDVLGIGAAVRAQSVPQFSGVIRSWRGAVLAATAQVDMQAQFGAPTIIAHRAALLALLRAALPADAVQLDAALVDFTQNAQGITAHFANGHVAHGAALIGADGLRSTVRAQLWGAAPPRYAGYTAWRAVVRPATTPTSGGESWGRGTRFGYIPMDSGWVYWFATINAPEGTPDLPHERQQIVAARFRDWHAPIPALIDATDPAAILHNDIYDRAPLRQWSAGRATLLGDAAHPMTPNLGQGACQALEDAVVLARCLHTRADICAALEAYQSQRIARTSALVRRSRQIGAVSQWAHPLACFARDTLLRLIPIGAQMRQLAPIIGYEV